MQIPRADKYEQRRHEQERSGRPDAGHGKKEVLFSVLKVAALIVAVIVAEKLE